MKVKLYLVLTVLLFSVVRLSAQSHHAEWLKTIETNDHTNSHINNVLHDGSNLIINGYYFGGANFLGIELPAAVGANAVISKVTTEGEPVWATCLTGNGIDVFFDMVIDNDNNIILTGWTSSTDTIRLNGEPVIYNDGLYVNHGMVMKISSADGSLIWFRHFAGEEYYTLNATKLAVDENNDIYVTGYYNCPFEIDQVSFPYEKIYGDNIFILKLDNEGAAVWGQYLTTISDGGWATIRSIISESAAVYYSLEYYSPYLVNGEPLPYSGEYYWLALMKMSKETGEITKVNAFGSDGGQLIQDITADSEGNILAVGFFSSEASLTIGDITLEGSGEDDGFILKTDSELNNLWAKPMGGLYTDRAFNVNIDENDRIYIGGGFDCYTEFTYDGEVVLPGRNPNSLSSFLIVTDKNGVFEQSVGMYGEGYESIISFASAAIVKDNNLINVYCTGNFYDNVEFVENNVVYADHNTGYLYKWILPQVVSVENQPSNAQISIYPNPFTDYLMINYQGGWARLDLYDQKGSLLHSQTITEQGPLAFDHLKTGIYLLRLSTEKTVHTFRIIKN
ncbi:MAG: T9SS type A sorting domain-containing protein [Lentimicrobium sp.]|nr:T9SS type A sorting domain-containing protein [Lentimicrobium sp.]